MRDNYGTLSRDIKKAIEYYCFNNLGNFYKRYQDSFSFSRATFYRAINNSPSSLNVIIEIEALAERIGLTQRGGTEGSVLMAKIVAYKELEKVLTHYLETMTVADLSKLKRYVHLNKEALFT